MINTELDLSASSEQYAWLAADPAAVNRLATPWVVVMGHRPVYQMSHELHDPNGPRVPPEQWKVDLALYGHEHYAEVTRPILNNTATTTMATTAPTTTTTTTATAPEKATAAAATATTSRTSRAARRRPTRTPTAGRRRTHHRQRGVSRRRCRRCPHYDLYEAEEASPRWRLTPMGRR